MLQPVQKGVGTLSQHTMDPLHLSGDAWPIICSHLDALPQLVLLCKTNKALKIYLDVGNGVEHWVRIARGACEKAGWTQPPAYWPTKEDAIFSLCPWLNPAWNSKNAQERRDTMSVGLLKAACQVGINLNYAIGDETVLCLWIRMFEHIDCSELLVAACNLGADVNASATLQEPRTPLMYAVSYFNLKHMRTLLGLGARTDIVHERRWQGEIERYTPSQMLTAATMVCLDHGMKRSFRPFYRESEWVTPLPIADVNAAFSLIGGGLASVDVETLEAKQNALGEAIHSYDDVFSRFSNI